MKKLFLIAIIILGVTIYSYSFDWDNWESEGWLSFGFEFSNFFESYTDTDNARKTVNSYIGSPGLNMQLYRFFNGSKFGIFAHGVYFGIPVVNTQNTNFNNYDWRQQAGLILGVGYRHAITEKLTFRSAVGFNWNVFLYYYDDYLPLYGKVSYDTTYLDVGIAGDIGLKINITNSLFLAFGSIAAVDFVRAVFTEAEFTDMSKIVKSTGGLKNFYMLGVRPYITLGFPMFLKSK